MLTNCLNQLLLSQVVIYIIKHLAEISTTCIGLEIFVSKTIAYCITLNDGELQTYMMSRYTSDESCLKKEIAVKSLILAWC